MNRRQHDQIFKTLLDHDPRGFLHLAGRLALDVPAEVTPLEREIVREPTYIDSGFRVEDANGPRLEHAEGFSQFKRADADRIAGYAADLAVAWRLPVHSTAVLLFEKYDRPDLPSVGRFHYGDFRADYPFQLLRLWRFPGDELLALGRPSLLPWLPLMAAPPGLCIEATRQLDVEEHPDATAMFSFLGELRYGRDVWQRVLEKGFRMIPEEILEQTSHYRKWTQRGVLQGRSEGALDQARESVCQLIAVRFPALAARAAAATDALTDLDRLKTLFVSLIQAADATAAERLLDDARPRATSTASAPVA